MTKKITPQSTFNAAWQAFIIENKPPAVAGDLDKTSCVYDDGKGNCCAFGLVLPPDLRQVIKINTSINAVIQQYPDLFDLVAWSVHANKCQDAEDVAVTFQTELHDELVDYGKRTWKFSLTEREQCYRRFAAEFSLTIPGEVK